VLVEEFGPHQLVPVIPDPNEDPDPEAPEPVPFVREVQEKRLRTAERKLAALGRVNPLALEEFAALEERHAFLTTQLEDLKTSKRDLLDIVKRDRRAGGAGLHRGLPRHGGAVRAVFRAALPRRGGAAVLTDPGTC
jgi:chromosome segregation protein